MRGTPFDIEWSESATVVAGGAGAVIRLPYRCPPEGGAELSGVLVQRVDEERVITGYGGSPVVVCSRDARRLRIAVVPFNPGTGG